MVYNNTWKQTQDSNKICQIIMVVHYKIQHRRTIQVPKLPYNLSNQTNNYVLWLTILQNFNKKSIIQ